MTPSVIKLGDETVSVYDEEMVRMVYVGLVL
jgi:hypothetical protein